MLALLEHTICVVPYPTLPATHQTLAILEPWLLQRWFLEATPIVLVATFPEVAL